MQANSPTRRRLAFVALLASIALFTTARVFGQGAEPLSQVLQALGPLGTAIELVRILGLPGLIFVIWYFDRKQMDKLIEKYKIDMLKMGSLVAKTQGIGKGYAQIAGDLKDVIMLNTEAMTKIGEAIETNQFCPMVRLKEVKKARGRAG